MTDRTTGRRALLRAGAALAAAAPAALIAPRVLATSRPVAPLLPSPICHTALTAPILPATVKSLKLTWNATAICTVGVPVAIQTGIFKRHNLDVETINFGGSTDQLLEAIATGKADAGVGMALRWLKPLEQGFDVRLTTGIHGGCMRLFTNAASGINGVADLKGHTVGVTDMAAPDKNFFSIVAAKLGMDPQADITWRAFPADLLSVALQKGEIQAFALGDPLGWMVRDREGLKEIANNLQGDYAHMSCCVLGVRGALIREDRVTAAALTQSLLEAQDWVFANPDGAAEIYAPYSKAKPAQLAAMLRSHTHDHHPSGGDLAREIAFYAQDLKTVQVLKPGTNPDHFARRVTVDVLASA